MTVLTESRVLMLCNRVLVKVNEMDNDLNFIDFNTQNDNRVIIPLDILKYGDVEIVDDMLLNFIPFKPRKMHFKANLTTNEYVGIFSNESNNYYIGVGDLSELKLNNYDFEGLVPKDVLNQETPYLIQEYAYSDLMLLF